MAALVAAVCWPKGMTASCIGSYLRKTFFSAVLSAANCSTERWETCLCDAVRATGSSTCNQPVTTAGPQEVCVSKEDEQGSQLQRHSCLYYLHNLPTGTVPLGPAMTHCKCLLMHVVRPCIAVGTT